MQMPAGTFEPWDRIIEVDGHPSRFGVVLIGSGLSPRGRTVVVQFLPMFTNQVFLGTFFWATDSKAKYICIVLGKQLLAWTSREHFISV